MSQTTRIVERNRYTHYLRIPAEMFQRLGLKLNQELCIEVTNPENPLAWEIRVKPLTNQKPESRSQSQSKKEPAQVKT